MRAAIIIALLIGGGGALSPIARAANYQASTAAFSLASGYSAAVNTGPGTMAQRTHHYAGTGPIDVFYSVANSGNGGDVHTYTLILANYTTTAIIGYNLELGTTTQDYYHKINMDADANPDYLDTDDDADGVADLFDNAPWVPNASQANTDFDSWGDAADIQPNNFSVPQALGGAPAADPWLAAPTTMTLNSHPGLFFAGTPSSPAFPGLFQAGQYLQFSGGSVGPGAGATLTFSVFVPDGLPFDGFVLRQTAVLPEPAVGAGMLLVVSALTARVRRRT